MVKTIGFGIVLMIIGLMIPAPGGAQNQIILAGTGDGQEVFEALAQAFEAANPGKLVEVPPTIDSSGGIRATAAGKCDLGRVARKPRGKEEKYNLTYRALAKVPVVFAINPSVRGVTDLTGPQLIALLSGNETNWQAFGGPEAKIYVIQREKGDAARRILRKSLPGFKKIARLEGYTAYTAAETLENLRKHPHTIAYIAYQAAVKADLRILKVDGAYPSPETIQNGAYPLYMTLGFVWKGSPAGLSKAFLDFAFSEKGGAALRAVGAIPVPH